MGWFVAFLEALLLVIALSVDAFATAFSYGVGGIIIPQKSVRTVNFVCSAVLGAALCLGSAVAQYIPQKAAGILCTGILFLLGLFKLFDSYLKSFIRRIEKKQQLHFSALHFNFILMVYADPQEADSDRSKSISVLEALSLAFALSLDSLGVGFGAALAGVNVALTVALSYICGMAALVLGGRLGRHLLGTLPNMDWLGGALLVLLAVMRM